MGLNFYRRREILTKKTFKEIENSEDNPSEIKYAIFREIKELHHKARLDKPEDLEDYNVNNENAQRYRALLKIWWSIPYGLDFIPYNINKGKTFGALNKYV
jgi:hypothetical protein